MRKILFWSLMCLLASAMPAFAAQAVAAKPAQGKAQAAPLNLNTASQADLEALPGVGPATAKKIVAGRPYASVGDLAKVGVPSSTIGKITSLVTVGATGAASRPAPAPAAVAPAAPPSSTAARPTTNAAAAAQAPPARGMVWVNLQTKVFHREGDRYYGKTKNGKFMTEGEAVKAGYREAKTAGKVPK